MSQVSLDDAKRHLNLPLEEDFDDVLIGMYIAAAEEFMAQRLNRPLDPWDVDDESIPLPVAVKQGILLLIGDFYANRESVAAGVTFGTNPTFAALINPYRAEMGI